MDRKVLLIAGILLLCLATACRASEPSYSAHVWEDVDGDGRQGEEEQPLEGIVVQIVDLANSHLWMRPMTDAEGNTFPFKAGDTCGQYALILNVPDGYWPTTPVVVNTPNCGTAHFGLKVYP
ncbi:MAG: hypothetical protein JSV69_10945 [Chloroflexota bacterium]|nr:MAG: hypothetical protein JSV69_10945 [Chloroflexota bacterium]